MIFMNFIQKIFIKFIYGIIGLFVFLIDLLISGSIFILVLNLFKDIDYNFLNTLKYGSLVVIIEISLFLLFVFLSYNKSS